MSAGKVIAGIGLGVALGAAFGFYGLAPNVEGGPGGASLTSKQQLQDAQRQAEIELGQSTAANRLLGNNADHIVADSLTDTSVAVISTPDAQQTDVDQLASLLDKAGASVKARIALSDEAVSTDAADSLKSIAAKSLPAGASLSEDKLTPGMHTGQLLGAALNKDASESDRSVAIGALGNEGYISHDGDVGAASVVIVVTGDTADQQADGNYANTFIADLALGVDSTTDGSVLAGRPHAADKGGAIALVRDSRQHVDNVSTVDNISSVAGRISAIRALAAQKDNNSKHVGVGRNATDPVA